ncbi:hypothetical protein [Nocardioides alkalitolerans]|uniref:hypothetical protein n=1 Tax=Nocardioides alkalitolerans TaxID=281714 RepID=UPI00041143C8|nr:hypothetical protein [Nocardioides alkalitolerans]
MNRLQDHQRGPELTRTQAVLWARRLPTSVFTVGPWVTLVAILALDALVGTPVDYPDTVPELLSLRWVGQAVGFGMGVALVVGAWTAPRLAAYAIAGLGFAGYGLWNSLPDLVAGVVWTLVLAYDAVLRRRQASTAFWNGPRYRSGRVRVDRVPWPRWRAVLALCAVLALVALVAAAVGYGAWRDAAVPRSEERVGVVVDVDTEWDEVTVALPTDDGRGEEHTFSVYDPELEDLDLGDPVTMVVDPEGGRPTYPLGDADPEGGWEMLLNVTGAALGLVVLVAVAPAWRRRMVTATAASAPAGLRVEARWALDPPASDAGGATLALFAVDAGEHDAPFAHLPLVVPVSGDARLLRKARYERPEMGPVPTDPRLAERWYAIWAEMESAVPPRVLVERTAVRVHGLTSDGSTVLVTLPGENLVLAGLRPVRDARSIRTVWRLPRD